MAVRRDWSVRSRVSVDPVVLGCDTACLWNGGAAIVSKRRGLLAQEHGVMSQKTRVFSGYDIW